MTKRKIPERAEDCHTIEDQLAFSQAVRAQWDALGDGWMDSPPSDIGALPLPDPKYPWSHPEWCEHFLDSQRTKERLLKRKNKKRMNRLLYSKPRTA